MPNLLLVMVGGAAGAGLRYGVGRAAAQAFGPGIPWGTLIVNLAGSLAIGLLAGLLLREGLPQAGADRPLWLLLAVGGLGGFTTFSAFSLELVVMLERGQIGTALGYAAASVVAGLALAGAGFTLTRSVA